MSRTLFGCTLATAVAGCGGGKLDLNQYPQERPLVLGVDCFMDGVIADDLHSVGRKLENELGVPVVVRSVGGGKENMKEIREAYLQNRSIVLLGYSMGCEETANISKLCKEEGIPIKRIIFYDPTFTNNKKFVVPGNVGETIVYLSSDKLDPMAWARGNTDNIAGEDVEVIKLKGSHANFVTWKNVGEDFKELASECSLEKVASSYQSD